MSDSKLSVGIVGLPNVGKSTLFNALTRQNVVAENYPFATIDPNVGVVAVPDERLQKLAELEQSKKIVPTIIEFVDIAGLVRNAHKGEGLGNQFLSHIREVDAIVQIVRCFEDPGIHHVEGLVNPTRDIETINTELILADLATLKKRLESLSIEAKSGDKKIFAQVKILEYIEQELSAGKLIAACSLTEEGRQAIADLHLLTAKPVLYVVNTSFDSTRKKYNLSLNLHPPKADGQISLEKREATIDTPPLKVRGLPAGEAGGWGELSAIPIDVKLEAELAQLSQEDKAAYMQEIGLFESGLDTLIKKAYETLGLITFLTTGMDETRAWTVRAGTKAPQAGGKIHSDFERGFIKAEVIHWQKLLAAGSWHQARDAGLIRTEGKDYVMCNGDVVVFKFNV